MSEKKPAQQPQQPQQCDLLISAEWVVTQDAHRTLIQDGAIAVNDDIILDVGPADHLFSTYAAQKTLTFSNGLVMPGLINGHTHSPMTQFRGLADDMPLMEWLEHYVFPAESTHTEETVYMGALAACAEMIRYGTIAFNDMHFWSKHVARAVDAAGIRLLAGEAIFGFPTPAYSEFEQALENIRENVHTYADHPRIHPAAAPHAVYTTTPEMLSQSFALAEELDLRWCIHLAETPSETDQCLEKFGKRPVQYLDDLGLLGERTLISHCVDVNQDEIELLACRKVKAVHNPESNMKLASGTSPVPALIRAGIVVGLGTDGPASNNNLNMFTEMTTCALVHKASAGDPTVMDAQTVLDAATLHSAQCLGFMESGSLTPGAQADLVVLDLTAPNLNPMYNPVSHLVYATCGGEVMLTMVGGRVLYSEGTYHTLDYPALCAELKDRARFIRDIPHSK